MFNTLTKIERGIIISVAQKNANGLNYGDDCEKRKNDNGEGRQLEKGRGGERRQLNNRDEN